MKTILKLYLLLFLLVCSSIPAKSQKDIASEKLLENIHRWSDGSILLQDGLELKGLVRFDDNSGLLNYQNGDISKTFIARTVAGFEFFDEETGSQRIFYTFEYDDGNSFKKAYFFEVLKEFEGFAVLSKVDPVDVKKRNSGSPGGVSALGGYSSIGFASTTTIVSQTETIYIMDVDGAIKPYVQILEKETHNLFSQKRTKNRFIAKGLLEEYTQNHYEQLKVFAEENDLTFKRKSDLIKILNHYQELLNR